MNSDLVFLPASQLAQAIRERQVSAEESVQAYLAQITRHNPAINAIATLDEMGALQRAREADRTLAAGETWGPLHGVPITLKDNFETQGLRSTAGDPSFSKNIPGQDAVVASRLRQAGAIILGKTNVSPQDRSQQTSNYLFGRTANPWKSDLTAGGSGGAAAVAAGFTALDIGSDLAGSLRIPAHFCGVFALKTTAGRVPSQGYLTRRDPAHWLAGWQALGELRSIGPTARSIAGLRLALMAIADRDKPGLQTSPQRMLHQRRIAWSDTWGDFPINAEVSQAVRSFAAQLADQGAQVQYQAAPGINLEQAWELSAQLMSSLDFVEANFFTRTSQLAFSWAPAPRRPVRPILSGWIGGAAAACLRPGIARLMELRTEMTNQIEQFLQEWDAWLAPVFPRPAFPQDLKASPHQLSDPLRLQTDIDGTQVGQVAAGIACAGIFNLTGHPVVTIPIQITRAGLPIGVQVLGRRWDEMNLLAVAGQIAEVAGGFRPPPRLISENAV